MGESSSRPPAYLDLNHVFDALAHPRRRYLLYTLSEEAEWTLWELATKVASWELDIPLDMVTDDEIERVYVSLYHNHIPRLVEDDVIEFSEGAETISAASNAEQVLAALEGVGGSTDHRQQEHAEGSKQNESAG